jgi:hypothetical protein
VVRVGTSNGSTISQHGCSTSGALATGALQKEEELRNTGRFIMYPGNTKIYDRKTLGHAFTKPVQIERTTRKFFPQEVVFHRSSHFSR